MGVLKMTPELQGILGFGMGTLANNYGNYGQFGPAVGRGGLLGLKAYDTSSRTALLKKAQKDRDRREQDLIDFRKNQAQLEQDEIIRKLGLPDAANAAWNARDSVANNPAFKVAPGQVHPSHQPQASQQGAMPPAAQAPVVAGQPGAGIPVSPESEAAFQDARLMEELTNNPPTLTLPAKTQAEAAYAEEMQRLPSGGTPYSDPYRGPAGEMLPSTRDLQLGRATGVGAPQGAALAAQPLTPEQQFDTLSDEQEFGYGGSGPDWPAGMASQPKQSPVAKQSPVSEAIENMPPSPLNSNHRVKQLQGDIARHQFNADFYSNNGDDTRADNERAMSKQKIDQLAALDTVRGFTWKTGLHNERPEFFRVDKNGEFVDWTGVDAQGKGSVTATASVGQELSPYEKKGQEDQVKETGELRDRALSAWKDNRSLDRFVGDSDIASAGMLQPALSFGQRFFASFGFDFANLKATDSMTSAINEILESRMHEFGARGLTDEDMKILRRHLPTIATSKESRVNIANVLKRQNNYDLQRYEERLEWERSAYPNLKREAPSWLKSWRMQSKPAQQGNVIDFNDLKD